MPATFTIAPSGARLPFRPTTPPVAVEEEIERVAPLIDVSFFVGVDHDIRVRRLVERHVRFGKSPGAAAAWATGPDEANARLIDGTAGRADHEIRLD